MSEEIKTFIDKEYNSIYSNLNVKWKLDFNKKIEEIKHKGIANSGISQSILTNYGIEIVEKVNLEVKKLIEESQNKFKFQMQKEDIDKYINKSINNNNDYLDKIKDDLIKYFDKKDMPLVESCKMQLENAKRNNENELNKIKEELILINKSNEMEAKKNRKISKETIIVGILIPILLFILGIILG